MKNHLLIFAVFFAYVEQAQFSECINPFTKIGDKFYYIESHQKLNWFAAAVRCIQLGGQLATIENDKELSQLSAHFLTHGYTSNEKDWIWISGFGKPGSYLAFSDPLRILPYAKWGPNEPNDVNSSEDCLCLNRKGSEFFMNDWHCRIAAQFICEAKSSINQASTDVKKAFLIQ